MAEGSAPYTDKDDRDCIREVDGILTACGWLLLVRTTVIFVALGAVIGLLVRVVIGPDNRPT